MGSPNDERSGDRSSGDGLASPPQPDVQALQSVPGLTFRKPIAIAVGVASVVVVVAIGLVLVGMRNSSKPADADEMRQKAIAFITANPTARYTGESTIAEVPSPLRGEVSLPDLEHSTTEGSGSQWLLIGPDSYMSTSRDGTTWTDLAHVELGAKGALSSTVAILPFARWLDEMLALDGLKTIETAGAKVVLGGTLNGLQWNAPAFISESSAPPLSYAVEIELTRAGEPRSLALRGNNGKGDAISFTFRYEGWGEAVAIAAPAVETIDPSPWLDEQFLGELRSQVEAVGPATPPPGLQLLTVEALAGAETAEGCPQIRVRYGTSAFLNPLLHETGDDPYFSYSLMPFDCAMAFDEAAFTPAEFGDLPGRRADDGWSVQFGETVARVSTSFEYDELTDVVETFAPIDLDVAIAAMQAQYETLKSAGG